MQCFLHNVSTKLYAIYNSHFHDSSLNAIISENMHPAKINCFTVINFRFIQWLFEQSKNAVTETTRSGLCSSFVTIIPSEIIWPSSRHHRKIWSFGLTNENRHFHVLCLVGFDITGLDSTLDWFTYNVTVVVCLPILMSFPVFMGVHIASALVFCVCDVLVFCWCPMSLFFCLLSFFHIVFAISLDCDSCNYPIACSFGILTAVVFFRWHTILWK